MVFNYFTSILFKKMNKQRYHEFIGVKNHAKIAASELRTFQRRNDKRI